MTDTPQNPWTLDEFVERLNEKAPLPQGDDARRAPAWTVRLVRHYASKQAMSPPERRGRQVYYGDQHLEEAKQLTALQQAGASSKTAAWALSNQYQTSALKSVAPATEASPMLSAAGESAEWLAQESQDSLECAESAQEPASSTTSTGERELADWASVQSRGPEEMAELNVFLSNSVIGGSESFGLQEHASAFKFSAPQSFARTENLLSRSEGPESRPAATTPPLGMVAEASRARALNFGEASIAGAASANAQSAMDAQSRFSNAGEPEMTPQQKALKLLNGFQGGEPFSRSMKKSLISKSVHPLPESAVVLGAALPSERAAAMPWKKWEPVSGLDIALREDLWPHEASLRQALAEWAKSLPEKT